MTTFVTTNQGRSAAAQASPAGPSIHIVKFKVGSDFSTPASRFDTDVLGDVLYEAAPSRVYWRKNSCVIELEMPANVGPFEFGNVGIFLENDVLYARMSYGKPQLKLSSVSSGQPNRWRINALLNLAEAPALFNIETGNQNALPGYEDFRALGTPSTGFDSFNVALVDQFTPGGETILVWKVSNVRWGIAKYDQIDSFVTTASSAPNRLNSSAFSSLSTSAANTYLVQDSQGNIAGIQSITGGVATLTGDLPYTDAGGSVFQLYKFQVPGLANPQVTGFEYNGIVGKLNSWLGAPYGSTASTAGGAGQTLVPTVANTSSIPTPANWSTLLGRLKKTAQLLGIPEDLPSTSDSNWNTGLLVRLGEFTRILQLADAIKSSNLRVPFTNTVTQTVTTQTRTSTWANLSLEVNFTFGSETHRRAFFNAGGWLGFRVDITADNYVQAIQEAVFSQLQNICLGAARTFTTGALRLEFVDGDGDLTGSGNLGYYGLTTSYKKVFFHRVPLGVGGGTTSSSGYLDITLNSRLVGVNQVQLRLNIDDRSGSSYSNFSAGGARSISGVVLTAIPNPALLDTPGVAHPSGSVQGSGTTW